LKKPVGIIAAYRPHLEPPDGKDKYAPKRRNDLDRAAVYAATEIRHAANSARQRIELVKAPEIKELLEALRSATVTCAEAADPPGVAKCSAAVKTLDAALKKTDAAAAGVVKIPQIVPEAIADESKASLDKFLKAKGPTAAEKEYEVKRSDPKLTPDDVIAACQAANSEAEAIADAHEKAEDALRAIAATHKMALDAHCGAVSAAETVRKELEACRKKKTPECSISCGKAKAIVEDGVPAAALIPLEKEYPETCDEKKK
jgi:hypothetical protein